MWERIVIFHFYKMRKCLHILQLHKQQSISIFSVSSPILQPPLSLIHVFFEYIIMFRVSVSLSIVKQQQSKPNMKIAFSNKIIKYFMCLLYRQSSQPLLNVPTITLRHTKIHKWHSGCAGNLSMVYVHSFVLYCFLFYSFLF